MLSILIEKYEEENYPIESPDPVEAIIFRMEQMGMTKKELAEVIGYKSRVSEIFSRKRKLTLKMIRNLHDKMKIPYESLIANYWQSTIDIWQPTIILTFLINQTFPTSPSHYYT